MFIAALMDVVRGVNEEDLEWDIIGEKSAEASTDGEGEKGDALESGSVQEGATKDFGKTAKDNSRCIAGKDIEENGIEDKNTARTMPKVDIPDHLRKNIFLAVLVRNVRMLLKEMNDVEAENEAKKQAKSAAKAKSGDSTENDSVESAPGCKRCALADQQAKQIMEKMNKLT